MDRQKILDLLKIKQEKEEQFLIKDGMKGDTERLKARTRRLTYIEIRDVIINTSVDAKEIETPVDMVTIIEEDHF